MNNLREVKDDLLKDWLLFREDEIASLTCDEDKHHWFYSFHRIVGNSTAGRFTFSPVSALI